MKDGDIVNFTLISPSFENSVTLRGNVASPGRYPWHEGMRISDLIPNRDFLITRDYWKQQNAITRRKQVPKAAGKVSEKQLNDVKRNAPEINWDYAVVQRISQQDLSHGAAALQSGEGDPGTRSARGPGAAARRHRDHLFAG